MKRVALSALQAFERTVRHGSQKAAAESLGVTPTAVSHAIRALEARLDVALLVPDGRGVRCTPSGKALSARLRIAFDEIDAALDELSPDRPAPVVSVTPGFAALWLAPRLARSAAQGQAVPIRIDATVECADLDHPGSPDIAVRYAEKADGEHVVTERFQAYQGSLLDLRETDPSVPFIETVWRAGSRRAPTWGEWFEAAGEAMPAGAHILSFEDEHHAVQCALAGEGRVLASSVLVSSLLQAGLIRIWRPDIWLPGQSYWLMTSRNRRLSRAGKAAYDALRSWFGAADASR